MHLQHVQKNLVLSVRITNATVSWKCISIANLQRWHKGSHQLHQTEASDQRHAWHALGAFGAWLQKEECQDYPPHWSPDCRRTLIVQIRVWFWAKSRSDFDFGQSQGLILVKSGCDFGQSQGLMLVNSRLNWRNSRLNLSKVKVWFWQGQGWSWAKSRSDW